MSPRPPILEGPALATSACYIAFFAVMGVHLPFWPLWLADWGLSAAEVGLYGALGIAVRIVAGLALPALADRLDARRAIAAACAALCCLLFIVHPWIGSRAALLAATLAIGAGFAALAPILEALGVAASRDHGFPYAEARGLGSLGYLAANLVVGAWIAVSGPGVALWWIVAFLAVTAVLAARHPGGAGAEARPPRLGEIGRLVLDPTFALFTAAVAFTQGSHAVLYAYASIHWHELGIGTGRIGALWALSVGVEVVFMVLAGTAVIAWLGPVRALSLACVAGILRFSLMMTDPVGWLLWPLQMLHAVTFALGHLGAIAFIARAVPPRYGAAAQGTTSALGVGIVMTAGMLLAALVYPALGGATYGIGAAIAAAGLVCTVLLGRRWDGRMLPI